MFPLFDPSGTAWLVELAIKSSLILGFGWGLGTCFRRAEARFRYSIWAASLLGVLAVPILSGFFPGLRLPVFPALSTKTSVALPSLPSGETARSAEKGPSVAASNLDGSTESEAAGATSSNRLHVVLVSVWLTGFVGVLGWLAVGLTLASHYVRTATPVTGDMWRGLITQWTKRMAIAGRVRVLKSEGIPTPMTWGVFRPVVLMPALSREWPQDRRRIVLLHELVHVKRKDWLFLLLGQLSCALVWFNPLVWFATKRMALEREHSCDDDVIALGTRPSDYARHLLDIARRMTANPSLPASSLNMASRSLLEERLRSILKRRTRYRRRDSAQGMVAGVIGITLGLALVHPWAEADVSKPEVSEPAQVSSLPPDGIDRSTADDELGADEELAPVVEVPEVPEGAVDVGAGSGEESSGQGERDPGDEAERDRGEVEEAAERELEKGRALAERGQFKAAQLIFGEVLRNDLENAVAWFYLAYSTDQTDENDNQALVLYERAARYDRTKAAALYNVACLLAGRGELDRAFEALQNSFEAGFESVESLEEDPELEPLRSLPGFDSLLAEAKSRQDS